MEGLFDKQIGILGVCRNLVALSRKEMKQTWVHMQGGFFEWLLCGFSSQVILGLESATIFVLKSVQGVVSTRLRAEMYPLPPLY